MVKLWFAAAAALVLVGTGIFVVAQQSGNECHGHDGADDCGARHERLRRHCADNPDSDVCHRHTTDRVAAYCREHPENERCRHHAEGGQADRLRAHCHEHPESDHCHR